jgi:hypothetical protein
MRKVLTKRILSGKVCILEVFKCFIGLWLRDAAEGNYLEDAPAWKAMRVAAGFTQDRSTVFYPRDIQPPDSLLRKVFPFLDESILQYKGSAEQCMAGKDFLELMLFLRVVFLQDTAILIRMV